MCRIWGVYRSHTRASSKKRPRSLCRLHHRGMSRATDRAEGSTFVSSNHDSVFLCWPLVGPKIVFCVGPFYKRPNHPQQTPIAVHLTSHMSLISPDRGCDQSTFLPARALEVAQAMLDPSVKCDSRPRSDKRRGGNPKIQEGGVMLYPPNSGA